MGPATAWDYPAGLSARFACLMSHDAVGRARPRAARLQGRADADPRRNGRRGPRPGRERHTDGHQLRLPKGDGGEPASKRACTQSVADV